MARLKDVVDECLLVAQAFTEINSDTYNEVGAVDFEDNDKDFPLFLFNKRDITATNDKYAHSSNLASQVSYSTTLYFMNTYTELEKTTLTLQAKQDDLIHIASKYFAELKNRTNNGSKGFIVGNISFNAFDETHNERLIQVSYNVSFITYLEDCTLGVFDYPIPSAIHVWDSENLTILGTTTTANDYNIIGVKHDLLNPAASNQPTYNSSDSNFNNLPTLSFNGVGHYLTKTFADFLISETSGEIHSVVRGTMNQRMLTLTSADSIGNNYAVGHSQSSFDFGHFVDSAGGGFNNGIRDTLATKPNEQGTILISLVSDGLAYRIFLNGVEHTVSMGSGANDGKWFSSVPDRDDITIGASLTAIPFYAVQDWAYTGYFNLLTNQDRNILFNELKLKYGI